MENQTKDINIEEKVAGEDRVEQYYKSFKGEKWREGIDVSDFIDSNYTEYTGDDSFLQGKSEKTGKVWAVCEKLLAKERKVHLSLFMSLF